MPRPAVSQFGESAHGIGRRRCPSVRTWGRFRVSGHAADGLGAQRRGHAAGGQARQVPHCHLMHRRLSGNMLPILVLQSKAGAIGPAAGWRVYSGGKVPF